MKNLFWKFFLSSVLITIIGYGIVTLIAINVGNVVGDELDRYTNLIGDTIIYKNDTLTVIDYSILSQTIKLDDGTLINIDLAEKLKKSTNNKK